MFFSVDVGFTDLQVSSDQREITVDYWNELVLGQAQGKVIVTDTDGLPFLTEPPQKTPAQMAQIDEQRRSALLAEAQQAISIWQTKLLMGRKLSDDENAKLNSWMDYIDLVNAIVITGEQDISWPVKP